MSDSVLSMHNVDIYQSRFLILNDINLQVNKGEFCYLIGKTGSGKSSFLKTVYAELPLRNGSAEVVGFDLKKLKHKEIPNLRRKLGMVFQDFNLLHDRSIFENLQFVLKATNWKKKDLIAQRIDEVLTSVQLPFIGHKFPHELSGGEQQRVAIARSLLNNPELIIADEPTGNLDPDTTNDIINLLRSFCNQGTAVLLATHDYRILEQFPGRIIRCANGTLSEE